MDLIDEKVTTVSGTEELLLTWKNNNPAFTYTVTCNLGKAVSFSVTPSSPTSNSKDILQDGYFAAPLFGGLNKVDVTVALNEDPYYYAPVTISKDLIAYSLAVALSGSITEFTVERKPTNEGTSVLIQWEPLSGTPKASDYKLYRIKGTSGNSLKT